MEASLPLTSLKGKKNLSTTVEVAVPLRVFRILEVRPHIIVNLLEPLQALLVTCELICLDEADCRLEVYPPEFLVPLELLHWSTFDVLEIEDSAVLLVPAELDYAESDLHALVNESLVVSADTEIHHEPKSLKVMAWVDLTALEAVNRCSIWRHILKHYSKLRIIEHIQDFTETLVDSNIKKALVRKNVLNLKGHVTDDHRKGESLHWTSSRI